MATEEQPQEPQDPTRQPLTPAKEKRLLQCFEHAGKQVALKSYDYATNLLAECVMGDPSNVEYVRNYLVNLKNKYGNNRTGKKLAKFQKRGSRTAVKKAIAADQWYDVIKHGLDVLTVNPWDIPALTAMATASEKMGDSEVEMVYLKAALESNPKDPGVNIQCAEALKVRQQFDQAIACLHRVELVRPDDEEIQRAISSLAVEKTITLGRSQDDVAVSAAAAASGQPAEQLTAQRRLELRIKREPKEMTHYLELSQVYINDENYGKAEEILAAAYEVSEGNEDVRDRWDDVQLRHLRQLVVNAHNEGDKETEEDLKKQLHVKELTVYKARCERYPNNLSFKYDLGLRYQLNGQYNEAIEQYQQAQNDPRRKGVCMLALGQCFQQIKQYRLAVSHYKSATEEIADRDAKNKKKSLHLLSKLALALKDFETAEKNATRLAAMDFTYKDVSELLDKITKKREEEEARGQADKAKQEDDEDDEDDD